MGVPDKLGVFVLKKALDGEPQYIDAVTVFDRMQHRETTAKVVRYYLYRRSSPAYRIRCGAIAR
jgi:hypothetical protein